MHSLVYLNKYVSKSACLTKKHFSCSVVKMFTSNNSIDLNELFWCFKFNIIYNILEDDVYFKLDFTVFNPIENETR